MAASALPPFGLIVPGQPVNFSFTQTAAEQWVAVLQGTPSTFLFFLTQSQPLPQGCGISVYLSSSCSAEAGFVFLGAVLADRPSSLFEVPASLLPPTAGGAATTAAMGPPPTLTVGVSLEEEGSIRNMLEGTPGVNCSFPGVHGSGALMTAGVMNPTRMGYGTPAGGGGVGGRGVILTNNATRYALGERVLEDFCIFISSYIKTLSAETIPAVLTDIFNSGAMGGSGQVAEEYVIMPASFVDRWRQRLAKKMKAAGGGV